MTLRDDEDEPATSLSAAVESSLVDVPRKPRDEAAVEALRLYARLLDDATDRLQEAAEDEEARNLSRMVTVISKIGPRFERMIDMLGMAPGARPTPPPGVQEGAGGDPRSEALQVLRDAAARLDPTSFVDPSVTEADAGD
jgi:plasmid stabilization system protein ParE